MINEIINVEKKLNWRGWWTVVVALRSKVHHGLFFPLVASCFLVWCVIPIFQKRLPFVLQTSYLYPVLSRDAHISHDLIHFFFSISPCLLLSLAHLLLYSHLHLNNRSALCTPISFNLSNDTSHNMFLFILFSLQSMWHLPYFIRP